MTGKLSNLKRTLDLYFDSMTLTENSQTDELLAKAIFSSGSLIVENDDWICSKKNYVQVTNNPNVPQCPTSCWKLSTNVLKHSSKQNLPKCLHLHVRLTHGASNGMNL
jgi:hypothetical protein